MSFGVLMNKNDAGASPSHTILSQKPLGILISREGAGSMMLEQTRHGLKSAAVSSVRFTVRRRSSAGPRETAEAIAAANLSLEKHWETYVHLMATTFGRGSLPPPTPTTEATPGPSSPFLSNLVFTDSFQLLLLIFNNIGRIGGHALTTYLNRLKGAKKKARETSIVCGVDILMVSDSPDLNAATAGRKIPPRSAAS
ncbi:hypothetical protein HPP92_003747 [Vanilla planifolia]|uniref:Uncharacterized protein n=1 Tax=Vanilla planifolia TaxID=51239 RepID=A0A835RVG4_VANPL|nr:hypothetical protein HPP92_003747 [Vanilla planifolia]